MKIKLRWKIILPLLVALFISNITVYFIVKHTSKSSLIDQIKAQLYSATRSVTEAFESKINIELGALEKLSRIPEIEDETVSLYDKQQIISHIHRRTSGNYYEMGFADKNGFGYPAGSDKTFDYKQYEFITRALTGIQTVSSPWITSDGIYKLGFAYPVRNSDNEQIGVVFSTISGNVLTNIISEYSVSENTEIRLIDCKTGNVIADRFSDKVDLKANNIKDLIDAAPKEAGAEYLSILGKVIARESLVAQCVAYGKETIVSIEPLNNAQWAVIAPTPYSDFSGKVTSLIVILFAALFVSFLIIFTLLLVVIRRTTKPLSKVSAAVNELSSGNGDLTQRIQSNAHDEIGDVVAGVNTFTEKLQMIMKDIKNSRGQLALAGEEMGAISEDTSTSVKQILGNIETVNHQIESQSSSVNQTAGAVNEIASNIESLENMIENQSRGVSQASAAVEQMIGNINSVNNSVEKMAKSFIELENDAQTGSAKQEDVNDKIRQIEDQSQTLQEANIAIAAIAEQTNLLAMNAAIEAAHAGEAGKGFSVVADEIRKLSETSTEQSKTIGDQLSKIQALIGEVVSASDISSLAFQSVASKIRNTDQLVRQIKNAMEEQQVGSRQISDSLKDMNNSTLEVRSASQEMSAGNQAILQEVRQLQDDTMTIHNSVQEMKDSARKVNDTETALSEISQKMQSSIQLISEKIDQFKV